MAANLTAGLTAESLARRRRQHVLVIMGGRGINHWGVT